MMTGVDKVLDLSAYILVGFGGLSGQMVSTAVNVGIAVAVVTIQGFDDGKGLLSGGGIIKIDQRVAMHRGVKNGE